MRKVSMRTGFLCVFLAAAALAQTSSEKLRNHFDSDAQMRAPAYFDFKVLIAPGEADWIVTSEQNPPSAPNIVAQTFADRSKDSIAVAVRRNVVLRDGRLSIAMRRNGGRGGILFRMTGEKDFLVLLVDSFSGDSQLISYRGGKPTEIARGQAVFEQDWGVLDIDAKGADIKARWGGKDGKLLFSAKDPAPASGRAGMATAGPGNAAFDEFLIEPAPEK